MADKPTANGDTNGIITPVDETNGNGAANDNNAPTNGPDLLAPEVVDESPIVRDPSLVHNEENRPFSWLQPHPIFVIALVGPEETPFGIQKDFLCAKSAYYKKYFVDNPNPGSLENLVRLPDTPVEVFAYAQNFLFTGHVSPGFDNLPSYDVLIGVWKLGHHLAIEGLCDATLDAMTDCRRVTQHIPATPLLVQVWKDTPEGSSIRKLLLSWAAEYMRSSDSRAEFARSLPQEVLSELVVAMSSLDTTPLVQVNAASADAALPTNAFHVGSAAAAAATEAAIAAQAAPRRNVHYLDSGDTDGGQARHIKKQRHSDVLPNGSAPAVPKTTMAKKTGPRVSLPSGKPVTKRRSTGFGAGIQPSTNQKLNFCADLLTRMLSGPGFWTRLVGPFKEPVDPASDGVPDYLEKVTKPMDLGTMKAKMDRREYNDDQEFLADMNQIFSNCYTYWSKKDPMWGACERLQKTFEEKFSQMNKWIAKLEGDEGGH
ncbi:hypothetical protein B0T26DRAFT_744802 [Lasiosphaeria miniovina]|uniref:Bromo domain-containing protein n=1 Tax=Lasiosphaeria miniovina TaxID=1954250 RepID=A0AA39ZQJ2_9PEZI|nr:uncharacterized protein B0T26DRAFT_744802 [Lasiosphaeria miniovina]KAK0701801.1 hypothetical protein B0T26DRAFT_744802 [Lasiosphaeria miniovina]